VNKNHRGIDVPIAAIVLAYIFCWPVGLVLTILRWVPLNINSGSSSHSNKTHISNLSKPSTQEDQYNQYKEQFEKYQNKFSQGTQANKVNQDNLAERFRQSQQQAAANIDKVAAQKSSANKRNAAYTPNNSVRQNKKQKKKASVKSSPITVLITIVGVIMLFLGFIGGMNVVSDIAFRGLNSLTIGDLLMSTYLFAGGGVMFGLRKMLKNRDNLFNRYLAIVGNRESMYLPSIAAAMSYDVKKVRRDLQSMIDKGYFGSTAYIDMSTANLMMHSEAVPDQGPQFDYKSMYDPDIFKSGQENNAPQDAKSEGAINEDIQITTGDNEDFAKIIREIRKVNDAIDDEQVSDRIYTIENITRNIFDYVGKKPDKLSQIRTFMNYYLPTTLKLLNSYSQIEKMGVAGENMKNAKENIEKILDMLVSGFEQQLDQLYKSEVLDISSDIEVLEQMMYKDGLAENTPYDLFTTGTATMELPEDERGS